MTDEYSVRLARARDGMQARGIGTMFIGPGADLRYLCGYVATSLERLTLLVIAEGREPVLVVPRLEHPRALTQGVGARVAITAWDETDDPIEGVRRVAGDATGVMCVSDRLWAAFVLRLQRAFPRATFDVASTICAPLRLRKDETEVAALREAGRIADDVAWALADERLAGWTERAIARWIGDRLLAGGCERVSFAIVGTGPHGASPHHEPTGRAVAPGDALVCDFGGTFEGYGSDITRTFVIGEPTDELQAIHDVVRRAQEEAVRAIKPGVAASAIDAAARGIIAEAGYGDAFIHRTGHGIGLEEHEEPYIVSGNDAPLEEGMAFSVEPGIYLEGRFGVRIEDIVVVTDDGGERLNVAPHELVCLPA